MLPAKLTRETDSDGERPAVSGRISRSVKICRRVLVALSRAVTVYFELGSSFGFGWLHPFVCSSMPEISVVCTTLKIRGSSWYSVNSKKVDVS